MFSAFPVFGVGVLARNPEVFMNEHKEWVAKFCLIGTDYEEIDGAVREFVTSVWFFAADPIATQLRKCKKGDQLIVEARIVASSVALEKAGSDFDYAFDVIAIRLGAKRGGDGDPTFGSTGRRGHPPMVGGANEEALALAT